MRRLVCLAAAVLLLLCTVPSVSAEEEETVEPYIRRMISYYQYYQEQAQTEIDTLLGVIRSMNPGQGALWEKIMNSWSWVNSEMEVQEGVLPDGLPQDDSLCIVVLGYGLNYDGSMGAELVQRLQVALASAEKYPNAYVLCTGGETAGKPGISEAGQMGNWLLSAGLAKNRLILETKSLSTTENALYTYDLLERSYPQVNSIAVITSDYHIRWGCAMFTTVRHWEVTRGGKEITLVGNAVCDTENDGYDSMASQALGISVITGIGLESGAAPVMEPVPETTAPAETVETEPAVTETMAAVEEVETEEAQVPWVPVLLGAAAVLAGLNLVRKRKTKIR